jgi:hypothetical protein
MVLATVVVIRCHMTLQPDLHGMSRGHITSYLPCFFQRFSWYVRRRARNSIMTCSFDSSLMDATVDLTTLIWSFGASLIVFRMVSYLCSRLDMVAWIFLRRLSVVGFVVSICVKAFCMMTRDAHYFDHVL